MHLFTVKGPDHITDVTYFNDIYIFYMSHDSLVGIALGYRLDDWGSRV
jgi:hypothetical protein